MKTVLFLALALCIPSSLYAQELVLYGSAAESCGNSGTGSGEGSLYLVNPDTGDTQLIGPIGFDGVTGLAVLGDGRMVATARQGADAAVLIRINPITGRGVLIGVLGDNNNPNECGRFPDITYDSVTDTLYATGFNCNTMSRSIFTIDPDTAQATFIGETGTSGGGLGLAMRSDGTLFFARLSGDDLSIYTIDRNTGVASLVGALDANIPPAQRLNINGMDFHPITGELFGSSTEGDPDNSTSYLVTVDETTPTVSIVGQAPNCFDGIVFATVPSPIPALSTWGVIAVVIAFGIAGLFYIRKRRVLA